LPRAGGSRVTTGGALPITVRGLVRHYGRMVALDGVDLDVAQGEFLTLLGPSGSGKTTLLMILAGFTRPDAGSIRFGDVEMVRTPPHKRNLGVVFQSYALFPHMDVAANVGFPLALRGINGVERARRVQVTLELVQLAELGGRRVDQLSGGQRQRVALARAIVFEPGILLMDEPLSALDKKLREQMQIELRHLHRRLGTTVIYVTHDQREALTLSDRIAVIDRGRIQQIDTPLRLYEAPVSHFVADFIGDSAFLEVTVAGGVARWRDQVITPARQVPDGAYLLVLRAEKLMLGDLQQGDREPGPGGPLQTAVAPTGPGPNRIDADVTEIVYQGDSIRIDLCLAGGDVVTLREPARAGRATAWPSPGDRVRLALDPADTLLVPAP
jgi:putative spermidine/putrescine transport system ATP-binding protein